MPAGSVCAALLCRSSLKCNDRLIFIDGVGGNCKSYLLNKLITYCTINNINTVTVVWTGIAANLIRNGRTVYTIFKLPLYIKIVEHVILSSIAKLVTK